MKLVRATFLAFSAFLFWGCSTHDLRLVPAASVPAASGNVQVGHDSNANTTIDLKVKHLAKPQDLSPPGIAYVIWAKPSDRPAQNQGELRVDENLAGEFKTTTAYKNFDLFVTSENSPGAVSPTGQEVLRQHINR